MIKEGNEMNTLVLGKGDNRAPGLTADIFAGLRAVGKPAQQSNPRMWDVFQIRREELVVMIGEYSHIIEAYRERGVPVVVLGEADENGNHRVGLNSISWEPDFPVPEDRSYVLWSAAEVASGAPFSFILDVLKGKFPAVQMTLPLKDPGPATAAPAPVQTAKAPANPVPIVKVPPKVQPVKK